MGIEEVSDLRSPLAKARDEWLESDEGKRASDLATLRTTESDSYLRNRLERAFLAGANWMEKHANASPIRKPNP